MSGCWPEHGPRSLEKVPAKLIWSLHQSPRLSGSTPAACSSAAAHNHHLHFQDCTKLLWIAHRVRVLSQRIAWHYISLAWQYRHLVHQGLATPLCKPHQSPVSSGSIGVRCTERPGWRHLCASPPRYHHVGPPDWTKRRYDFVHSLRLSGSNLSCCTLQTWPSHHLLLPGSTNNSAGKIWTPFHQPPALSGNSSSH